jgi:hypothetical protein
MSLFALSHPKAIVFEADTRHNTVLVADSFYIIRLKLAQKLIDLALHGE